MRNDKYKSAIVPILPIQKPPRGEFISHGWGAYLFCLLPSMRGAWAISVRAQHRKKSGLVLEQNHGKGGETMSAHIESCPFCGYEDPCVEYVSTMAGKRIYFVSCPDCGARGPMADGNSAEDKAVRYWHDTQERKKP